MAGLAMLGWCNIRRAAACRRRSGHRQRDIFRSAMLPAHTSFKNKQSDAPHDRIRKTEFNLRFTNYRVEGDRPCELPKRRAVNTLLPLTAADLMSAPVTSIPHDMLLRDAGHLLIKSRISGAPVVDSEGNCIGILSSSDFIGWAETGGEMEKPTKGVSFIAPWGEIVSLDACEGCVVRKFMTRDPITIEPTASIGEIAQKLIDAGIHRVLVTEGQRPCGIVSTIDIVAAVADASRRRGLLHRD